MALHAMTRCSVRWSTLLAGLLAVVTSANVACGYHAGTPATMRAVTGSPR